MAVQVTQPPSLCVFPINIFGAGPEPMLGYFHPVYRPDQQLGRLPHEASSGRVCLESLSPHMGARDRRALLQSRTIFHRSKCCACQALVAERPTTQLCPLRAQVSPLYMIFFGNMEGVGVHTWHGVGAQ